MCGMLSPFVQILLWDSWLCHRQGEVSGMRLHKAQRAAVPAVDSCQHQAPERVACAGADAVRGENLRFFPELRHRVAKMLRVLAYDSGGAALPELLRPGTPPTTVSPHPRLSAGLFTRLAATMIGSHHHWQSSSASACSQSETVHVIASAVACG